MSKVTIPSRASYQVRNPASEESPFLEARALKKMPIFGKTNENVVSFYTCEQFSDIQIPSLF